MFKTFKENVNKHFEKLKENYNFLLLSTLIAGWDLNCSPSFAIVPGFRGKVSPFPSPPLVYKCTVYNETWNFTIFPISNPMQINMQLILIVFPLEEEGKSCALFWHAIWVKSLVHKFIIQSFSVCVCVCLCSLSWYTERMNEVRDLGIRI